MGGREGGIGARGVCCETAGFAATQNATVRHAAACRKIFGEEATPIPPCEMLINPLLVLAQAAVGRHVFHRASFT